MRASPGEEPDQQRRHRASASADGAERQGRAAAIRPRNDRGGAECAAPQTGVFPSDRSVGDLDHGIPAAASPARRGYRQGNLRGSDPGNQLQCSTIGWTCVRFVQSAGTYDHWADDRMIAIVRPAHAPVYRMARRPLSPLRRARASISTLSSMPSARRSHALVPRRGTCPARDASLAARSASCSCGRAEPRRYRAPETRTSRAVTPCPARLSNLSLDGTSAEGKQCRDGL